MISKIMMFAMSIASRGKDNKKITEDIKKLRYVSCYGLDNIDACPHLTKSSQSNFYYCGGCGCGDKPHTWLIREEGEYSKLDYPFLNCPMKMPGFSNYDPNSPENSIIRKKQIEELNPQIIKKIELTVSANTEKEELFDKIHKIIKNS